jgi:hypothetical protein
VPWGQGIDIQRALQQVRLVMASISWKSQHQIEAESSCLKERTSLKFGTTSALLVTLGKHMEPHVEILKKQNKSIMWNNQSL